MDPQVGRAVNITGDMANMALVNTWRRPFKRGTVEFIYGVSQKPDGVTKTVPTPEYIDPGHWFWPDRDMKKWKILESNTILKNQWFDIKEHKVQMSELLAVEGVIVLEFPDWVNIVALDDKDRVVLERNYRHARGDFFIETPSGSVEASDASPLEAARRELLEETGYAADRLISLGVSAANGQLMNNRIHHFLALDCRWVQRPQQEFEGSVESWVEPWSQVMSRIDKAEITNSYIVEGLLRAERQMHKMKKRLGS